MFEQMSIGALGDRIGPEFRNGVLWFRRGVVTRE